MSDPVHAPTHVALESAGVATNVVALEISGHHCAVRAAERLPRHAPVCLHLGWSDGAVTSLPGTVEHVEDDLVTRIAVNAIEDDWSRFLTYVGESLLAG